MWSAGEWTTGTYRVNTAVADSPVGPFINCHTVLSTGDGTVANGPGHNGYIYVQELDMYLAVYHRHNLTENEGNARFICIDRMEFDENGNIMPIRMTNGWTYKNKKVTDVK